MRARIRTEASLSFLVLLLALLPTGATSGSGGASWHASGYGGGGRFTAIAVNPSDPRIVFIGSDVAGLFRSRDGGDRFEPVGKGLEGFAVADIAINPALPGEVAALTREGLYISTSGGDHWTRLSNRVKYDSGYSGSRLLVFTQQSLWVATDTQGVFRLPLNDLQSAPQPLSGLEGIKVNGLAVFDGYLYAGTARGVFRWEERRWRPQGQGLAAGMNEIMDIAASRNSLYIVERQAGLFRWSPARDRWEARPVTAHPKPRRYKSLLVDPSNPELVFLASHPEEWPHLLYRSADGGATWQAVRSFRLDPTAPQTQVTALTGIEEIAIGPGPAPSLFIADWWNLWRSGDGGNSWQQRHRGLQNTCVNDLKVHPQNPRILYQCAWDVGLMVSEDGGANWTRRMSGVVKDGHAQEIEISPKDPSRMFLLVNHVRSNPDRIHLYASRDAGANWKDIGFSLPAGTLPRQGYADGLATNLELDPFSDQTLYVGTNGHGVYKTVNGGRSWEAVNGGLDTPFIKGPGALRAHPSLRGTLFASTLAGGIYRSTDGGISWRRTTTGNHFTFGIAISPTDPTRIVAGGSGNLVLVSQDGGASWTESRLPIPDHPQQAVYSVAFDHASGNRVLAGTLRYDALATEGLFISTDGAKTFRRVPMEIPKVSTNILTSAAGGPNRAYVGFVGTGIYRLDAGDHPQ